MVLNYNKAKIFLLLSFWAFSLAALNRSEVLEQSERLDFILEKWALKTVNYSLHDYILSLRQALHNAHKDVRYDTSALLSLHNFIVEEITLVCVENIEPPYSDSEQVLRQVSRFLIDEKEETLYKKIEGRITNLSAVIDDLDYKPFTSGVNRVWGIAQRIPVTKIADRVWPYALLTAHWFLAMPSDKIGEIFYKEDKKSNNTTTNSKDASENKDVTSVLNNNKEQVPQNAPPAKNDVTQTDPKASKTTISSDKVSAKDTQQRGILLTIKQKLGGTTKIIEPKPKKISTIEEEGWVKKKYVDLWKPIISLDLESSLFKISIPLLVKDRIVQDAKDLYGITAACIVRCKECLIGGNTAAASPLVLTESQRAELIDRICNQYGMPSSVIDCHYLVQLLEGTTEIDIKALFEYALQQAHDQNRAMTMQDIEKALDVLVRKVSPGFLSDTEKEKRAATIAGMIVMHHLLYRDNVAIRATLYTVIKNENEKYEGYVFTQKPLKMPHHKNEYLTACMHLLAPAIAHKILLEEEAYDILEKAKERAYILLEPLVLQGSKWHYLPEKMKQVKLEALYEMIEQCRQKVYVDLLGNKDKMQHIFKALQNRGTLNKEELAQLCNF
jgi:hypothetical protein